MRNSALAFLLGEHLFFRSGVIRTSRSAGRDIELHDFWLQQTPAEQADPPSLDPNPDEARAIDGFLTELAQFHDDLTADRQRHILLVQPHLSLRDRSRLRGTEAALYNYFRHLNGGRPDNFIRSIHQRVATDFSAVPEVVSLAALHDSDEWIFLDYCHLTRNANRLIAIKLAESILGAQSSADVSHRQAIASHVDVSPPPGDGVEPIF